MPKLTVSPFDGHPILDIASYARRGVGRRDRLSSGEIELIVRTAGRAPEAVVKVLPRHSAKFMSVSRHIDYIGRDGELELETDEGERLGGKSTGRQLLEDWDLDLDEHRRQADLSAASGRKPPKLVHKLMFSMPPGTPAEGVLAAARNFLREEFALKHRYAFVLHTDEPHPHVHAVVKAVSEQGIRLNVRKATLRAWRSEFARHLRAQGIEANATERAVRGVSRTAKLDGIYRAARRGASTHADGRTETVVRELLVGDLKVEPGKIRLAQTRRTIESGWTALRELLSTEGRHDLAARVRRFVDEMPAARTEKEQLAAQLQELVLDDRRRTR